MPTPAHLIAPLIARHNPRAVWEWHGNIPVDVLRPAVLAAWLGVENPNRHLSRSQWVELFRTIGYTSAFRRAAPPASGMLLYRGAEEEFAEGMSWTPDLNTARAHAYILNDPRRPRRSVWKMRAKSSNMLADFSDGFEREYVVIPTGAKLVERSNPQWVKGELATVRRRAGMALPT